MSESQELIKVEVAYALPGKQKIIALDVPQGTSAYSAVEMSNIAKEFPEINLDETPMGIFSQPLGIKGLPPSRDYELQAGDRIELYRPLIADPKEVRKQRAAKAKEKRAKQ